MLMPPQEVVLLPVVLAHKSATWMATGITTA
jgi:hypothetical protein